MFLVLGYSVFRCFCKINLKVNFSYVQNVSIFLIEQQIYLPNQLMTEFFFSKSIVYCNGLLGAANLVSLLNQFLLENLELLPFFMPFHGLFGNALFFGLGLPVIKTRLACQPASQCFSPVQNLVTFSKKHSHYATFFKTYLCFQQNSTFEAFYGVFYHLPIWVGVLLDESDCLYTMMRGLQPRPYF